MKNLELQWVFQARSLEKFEATPLVVDGVMYTVQPPNDVVALDAATGRVFWVYPYIPSPLARLCCGRVNRGLAIHENTLFMATIDGRLIALDAKTGGLVWNVAVGGARPDTGYSLTVAPLVIKDKVIIGTAGGEYGVRGFIAAFDAKSGREAWRFHTIAGPGEPGRETWAGDSWKTGGGSIWVTGTYDAELNLTYWGVGNPGPDWNGDGRLGDNLYSDSVVALDADTGALKWHFQFTPHDVYDYDSVQVPVLADIQWQGRPRKAMLFGNRNGFFYVLDRATGEFLLGKPFTKVTWTTGLDAKGRPQNMVPLTRGRRPDLSGRAGRHQLVFAVVQSAHRAVLSADVGRHVLDVHEAAGRVQGRAALHRRPAGDADSAADARSGDQSPAAGRRIRRHPGDRSEDGREEVGVQDGRRRRRRRAQHRVGRAVLRQP